MLLFQQGKKFYKNSKCHSFFITSSFIVHNNYSCFFHRVYFAYFYASESVLVRFNSRTTTSYKTVVAPLLTRLFK